MRISQFAICEALEEKFGDPNKFKQITKRKAVTTESVTQRCIADHF